MKIILDNDATVCDYRRFIDGHAIPYFKKKYNMDVIHENELELESLFDCKNVLIKRGYSDEDADKHVKRIVDKFWISPRYIVYSMPWMFFPKVAKTMRILKKQGHRIEIHTSKIRSTERNILGKAVRVLMYLQYWSNGCFIPCNRFKFYENDDLKLKGMIGSYPEVVFEDKPLIIEALSNCDVKCICVSGKHNKGIKENKNIKRLDDFSYHEVCDIIANLLGKSKWKLYNEIAISDRLYNKLLKLRFVIRWKYKPIVLSQERLNKADSTGVIYASNHRSTLDPMIITTIINEPIRYAALKRFFEAKDSIFNNSKNPYLCRITAWLFRELRYFPIERICDKSTADNTKSLMDMVKYSNIKGKIGIFPEGTTLKNQEIDFGKFEDSFIKLAVSTNAIIQPISILWFEKMGKQRCIVNFGEAIDVKKYSVMQIMDIFIETQKCLLEESRDVAKQYGQERI